MIGNPFVWWISITGTFMFSFLWLIDRIILQRGIDDLGAVNRQYITRSIGFIFVAWLLHWVPFSLKGP